MPREIQRIFILFLVMSFTGSSLQVQAFAQMPSASHVTNDPMPFMPQPGTLVQLSPPFSPACLKGIVVHPENPFKFDFIIYRGDTPFSDAQKRQEYTKLTKYFLASLAIPDDDQWVNLSPYEKDRIIKDDFGKTEMGRDLLAQDYLLKQITASLIDPQDGLGRKFWDRVYSQAQEQYGTTNIPVNTFNKVWILPDDALIYEKGHTAYVLKNHLRVMLEEDYLSLQRHLGAWPATANKTHSIASKIVREIVLPELLREVNEDRNFAPLRQVYSGMLLAAWFKHTLRQSLLGQIYANKGKVRGVDQDPRTNDAIYRRYLQAYKKGVFNFIKEDADRLTNEMVPRKYFSGGTTGFPAEEAMFAKVVHLTSDPAQIPVVKGGLDDSDLAVVEMSEETAGSQERSIDDKLLAEAAQKASYDLMPGGREEILKKMLLEETPRPILGPYIRRIMTIKKLDEGYLSSKLPGFINILKMIEKPAYIPGKRVLDGIASAIDEEDWKLHLLLAVEIYWSMDKKANLRTTAMSGRGKTNAAMKANPKMARRAFVTGLLLSAFKKAKADDLSEITLDYPFGTLTVGQENPDAPMVYQFDIDASRYRGIFNRGEPRKEIIRFLEPYKKDGVLGPLEASLEINKNPYIRIDWTEAKRGQNSKITGWKIVIKVPPFREARAGGKIDAAMRAKELTGHAALAKVGEQAMKDNSQMSPGGIDMNSADLNLRIRRDGLGMPLPLAQQDLARFGNIQGLEPVILSIQPASQTPLFADIVGHS